MSNLLRIHDVIVKYEPSIIFREFSKRFHEAHEMGAYDERKVISDLLLWIIDDFLKDYYHEFSKVGKLFELIKEWQSGGGIDYHELEEASSDVRRLRIDDYTPHQMRGVIDTILEVEQYFLDVKKGNENIVAHARCVESAFCAYEFSGNEYDTERRFIEGLMMISNKLLSLMEGGNVDVAPAYHSFSIRDEMQESANDPIRNIAIDLISRMAAGEHNIEALWDGQCSVWSVRASTSEEAEILLSNFAGYHASDEVDFEAMKVNSFYVGVSIYKGDISKYHAVVIKMIKP